VLQLERNFSTAGMITLGSSTVEASALVAQAVKKNLLTCDYDVADDVWMS